MFVGLYWNASIAGGAVTYGGSLPLEDVVISSTESLSVVAVDDDVISPLEDGEVVNVDGQ